MMISRILTPKRVTCRETVNSKKRALERLSQLLAMDQPELSDSAVFEKLIERERLGSTALGEGVAIPHCRMRDAREALIALMTLHQGVDFDARDGRPVDIVFALIVPENCDEKHLKILATAAEMFSKPDFCNRLRDCGSDEELYTLVHNWQPDSLSA